MSESIVIIALGIFGGFSLTSLPFILYFIYIEYVSWSNAKKEESCGTHHYAFELKVCNKCDHIKGTTKFWK